jgi:hypothetical protein
MKRQCFVDKVTIRYLALQKSDSFSAVLYCDPSFCILILWLREIFKCVRGLYGCTDRRLRHCSNTDLARTNGQCRRSRLELVRIEGSLLWLWLSL